MSLEFEQRLKELFRHAYGPRVITVYEKEQTIGVATGLIMAKALTSEEVGRALEEGITAGLKDWTPEIRQAVIDQFFFGGQRGKKHFSTSGESETS